MILVLLFAIMTKEEIIHLGKLSRISLTDAEIGKFNQEIDAILEYVASVKNIAEGEVAIEHPVTNVFRDDVVTNESGSYTATLLKAMPKQNGEFLEVKKILQQSE